MIAEFIVGFGWLTRLKCECKIHRQVLEKEEHTQKTEIPFLSYTITKKGWSFTDGTFSLLSSY